MSDGKDNHENYDYTDWYRHSPPPPPSPFELERRVALLEQSTKTIKDELSKINGNISKLVWIVLTAVILAGINIIFNGAGGV